MAEVTFDVTPATPQKRPHEDEECTITSADHIVNSERKASTTDDTSRNASPTPSSTSSLTELTSNNGTTPRVKKVASIGPPAKKPKLTFLEKEAEKAAKQREKDEKTRQKAEEKARKDEERRKANEEKEAAKRAKEIERAEKQEEKDAKKQAEQQKKDAKEAEKLKKERVRRPDHFVSQLTWDRLRCDWVRSSENPNQKRHPQVLPTMFPKGRLHDVLPSLALIWKDP